MKPLFPHPTKLVGLVGTQMLIWSILGGVALVP